MTEGGKVRSMEPVTVDRTTLVLTSIQAAYGVPSFIIMVFMFFFLGCRKNYSHSFYRLVQLDLLTNIVLYANTWIGVRAEAFPVFTPFLKGLETHVPGSLSLSKTLTTWFFHMQFCTAIALSFHRITSVVFHSNYESAWRKLYIPFGILCVIYSSVPIIMQPGMMQEVQIIDGVLSKVSYATRLSSVMSQIGIFSAVYFILLLAVGLGTACLVRKKFTAGNVSDRGISKKLTKIALTYGFVYTGILLWSVLGAIDGGVVHFFPDIVRTINTPLMAFASDMMTLALPYILFLFDTNVQHDLFPRKKKNGSQIFVASPTTAVSR